MNSLRSHHAYSFGLKTVYLLSITEHDAIIHGAERYDEESSQIRPSQILWEAFKFSAEFC